MAEHDATRDEVQSVLESAQRDGVRSLTAWAASRTGRTDFALRLAEDRRCTTTKRAQRVPCEEWPPWCGKCDRDSYRWLQTAEGRWLKCPDCNNLAPGVHVTGRR
jgi:hypothetical protein